MNRIIGLRGGWVSAQMLLTQCRQIKTMVKRTGRWKSYVKDAIHYNKRWVIKYGDGGWQDQQIVGHEKEATENFAQYRFDARVESSLLLATPDLKSLPPTERFNAMVPLIAARWKVDSVLAAFEKLKMAIEALECFEDAAKTLGTTVSDLSGMHLDMYAAYVETVLTFAKQSHREGHDGAVAGLLRVAEIADALQDQQTRGRMIQNARHLVETMTTLGPLKDPQLVTVKPPRPERAAFMHHPDTSANMLPRQKASKKAPQWLSQQATAHAALRPLD